MAITCCAHEAVRANARHLLLMQEPLFTMVQQIEWLPNYEMLKHKLRCTNKNATH